MKELITQTLARLFWCFLISGIIWIVAWITNPNLDSGTIWVIGFSVGLITWQEGLRK